MTDNEEEVTNFLALYNLRNLVQEPICYKTQPPRCIDLVLINCSRSVQQITTVETGLFDFHKMAGAILKTNNDHSKLTIQIT